MQHRQTTLTCLPVVHARGSLYVVHADHEEVPQLEGGLGSLKLPLDLAVRVVDDGEEHVEEDEEHEEDVGQEEGRAHHRVRRLYRDKVEVPEDGSEEGVAGVDGAVVVPDLDPEQQVAKLGEGEEDDRKHDGEAAQLLGALGQCARQLVHRLVEGEVL